MSGQDTTQIRVAGAGNVWVADEGTTLPDETDPTTPPGVGWVDMGYVTTDGVTFTFARESEDLDSWQADKVRVLTTADPMSVSFSLLQSNADVMVLAMGGGTIESPVADVFKYVPAEGANNVRAMIIDFQDSTINYRYVMPKVQVEGEVAYTLVRDGALTYPMGFGVLDGSPKYYILTDDPAFTSATLTVATAKETAAVAASTKSSKDSK